MNSKLKAFLPYLLYALCYMLLIAAVVLLTDRTFRFYESLEFYMSQMSKATTEAKEHAALADMKTELAEMRAELKRMGDALLNSRELAELSMERLIELHARLDEMAERLNRPMEHERMEGPPQIERIAEDVGGAVSNMLMFFREEAEKQKRMHGEYWEDGELTLDRFIRLPRAMEFSWRYFASPDRDKYTLVVMPEVELPFPPEERENIPRVMVAITSGGGSFFCLSWEVKAVEELVVLGWEEENNLPDRCEWRPIEQREERPFAPRKREGAQRP
ncbi:MAG: hypothetical protein Kow00107_04350 [Planctomycetota bacterium]